MSDKATELAEALCRSLDIKSVTVHMGGMSKTLEVAPWVAVSIREGMSFARSAALEESAKVADELALALIERPHTYVTPHKPTQDAIATAIRALKDKPNE